MDSCYQLGSVLSITQEAPRQRSSAEGEPWHSGGFIRSPFFLNLFSTDLSVVLYAVPPSAPLLFPRVCLCDRMECETFLGDILTAFSFFSFFVLLGFLCFHLERTSSFFSLFLSLSSVSRSHFRSQLKASVLGVCRLITVLSERRLAQISCAPTFPRLFKVKAFCGCVGKSKK